MESSHCQPPGTLRAYALGQLPEEEADSLATHVADCPSCEETLAGFDDTADSLIGAVREVGTEENTAATDTEELQAALQRVINPFPIQPEQNEADAHVAELVGDYELIEQLGHGGMGTVYKALHRQLERIVAVKLLPARRLRAPQAIDRFRREMKAIRRLNHPSIVRATGAGEIDGTHFLAMDFVDGLDLSQLVKLTGRLQVADACEIMRQTAIALQYAHEQKLIHRDVKPGNLMPEFSATGDPGKSGVNVKVMDLGLALFGAASEVIDELTTVGQLMGTLDYMAPEQADSGHMVDETADVYGMGATLFKLLTGTAPYETAAYRTPLRKMKALSLVDAPSIAERRDDLPDELVQIIDTMLLRDTNKRPQSAQDVATLLQPFCDGHELSDLLQQGLRKQPDRNQEHSNHNDDSIPARSLKAAPTESLPTAAKAQAAAPPAGGFIRRIVFACAGMAGAAALAGIIWLQTDKGTLKIESANADIPVQIRQGKNTVESLTLTAGINEVKLASGKYEVVLPVKYDDLIVTNGSVEIRRGSDWVARVSKAPQPPGANESSVTNPFVNQINELTFEGKPFDFWKRVVTTERSKPELTKAVRALCSLGQNHRDAEAAEAVLTIVMRFDARKHLSNEYIYGGEHYTHNGSVTRLLLTSIDQLRALRPDKVVSAVIEKTQTTHNPNMEFTVATFLAPQQVSASKTDELTLGSGADAVSIRNGKPLMEAFYSSPEWISLLENEFSDISEELRLDYLQYLISRHIETNKTAPLTSSVKKIAFAAARGEHGKLPRSAACELLTRCSPSHETTRTVMEFIHSTRGSLTFPTSFVAGRRGLKADWHYGNSRTWAMLRSQPHNTEFISTLIDWVEQSETDRNASTNAGATPPNTKLTSQNLEADGQPKRNMVRVTTATLAAEILSTLGSRAEAAVPALHRKIAALCGQPPVSDGKWGYSCRRNTTLIPSLQQMDETKQFETSFANYTPNVNELDSLIFATQKITSQPIRFNKAPQLLQLRPDDVPLTEFNGETWKQLLDEAESLEPISVQKIEALRKRLSTFKQELSIDVDFEPTATYSHALKQLIHCTLKLPANDGDENESKLLRTLVHDLEPEPAPQYEELIADCLEATDDPIWQSRIIKEFIARSAPVSTGNEGQQQLSGVSVPIITAQSLLDTGKIGPRLLTALREVYANADLSSDALIGALLDCIIISQLHQENMELQKTILASKKSTFRLRAASILILEKQLNRSERRTALELLLSSVLSPPNPAEMINSALPLLAMPGKYWQAKDVRRIIDFLKNDPQKSQPMFVVSVPDAPVQSEAVNDVRWNVISKEAYPVRFSQRILLAHLLIKLTPKLQSTIQQELTSLRDTTAEIPQSFAFERSDSLELLFSRFQSRAMRVNRIEEPDVSEDNSATETEVFNAHLRNAVRHIE